MEKDFIPRTNQIGVLWERESKTKPTKKYLVGFIKKGDWNISILIFRNTFKTRENQPDYHILLSDKFPRKLNEKGR